MSPRRQKSFCQQGKSNTVAETCLFVTKANHVSREDEPDRALRESGPIPPFLDNQLHTSLPDELLLELFHPHEEGLAYLPCCYYDQASSTVRRDFVL